MGFAFLMLILAPWCSSIQGSGSQGAAQDPTSWTIMVYMAADSSISLPWQDDINEMEAADQREGTSVIVLLDTFGGPDSRLLKIAQDPNGLEDTIISTEVDDGGAVISGGEINSGDPAVLTAFIGFSSASYPADRLVLILWGHGSGWHGLCPDGSDFLTLPEVRIALSDAHTSIGRSLDIVSVDACAQGSLEMLFQIEDHADYFVASEKDVPYEGLPYTLVLDSLAKDTEQSPEDFASSIVDDYHLWTSINSIYATTMAVYDLSKLEQLSANMTNMFALAGGYTNMFRENMVESITSAEHYEEQWYVDFGDLMDKMLRSDLPLELRQLALANLRAYSQLVIHFELYSYQDPYDGVFANRSTGAVIYAVSSATYDSTYSSLAITATTWFALSQMIRNDTVDFPGEAGPSVTYSDEDDDGRTDSLTLSWATAHDQHMVWAYRDHDPGVEFAELLQSAGTDIVFDLPGNWLLATSAWTNGSAVSYAIANVTLHGFAQVTIVVLGSGAEVHAVTISSAQGEVEEEFNGPSGTVIVSVPEFAEPGQLLTVRVRDVDNGNRIGERTFFLAAQETEVFLEVHETDDGAPSQFVPLILAILPGLLILGFAATLAWEDRKRKRDKA